MLNAPSTNFISNLRKNFINFAHDRIQTKISLYRDMPPRLPTAPVRA